MFTPLASVLPLAARAAACFPSSSSTYGLNLIWRRAPSPPAAALGRVVALGCAGRLPRRVAATRSSSTRSVSPAARRATLTPCRSTRRSSLPCRSSDGGRRCPHRRQGSRAGLRDVCRRGAIARRRRGQIAHPRNLEGVELPPNVRRAQSALVTELRERTRDARVRRRAAASGTTTRSAPKAAGSRRCSRRWRWRRPIVATDRAILRDYVDDGVEALLVPAEDPLRCASGHRAGTRRRRARARHLAAPRVRGSSGLTRTRGFAAGLAPVLRAVV